MVISYKETPPGFEKDLMKVAIDFDGVIHTFDKGWYDGTCYGEPIEGSLESVRKIAEKHEVVIYTAKAKPDRPLVNGKTGVQLVSEWLEKHGILECVSEITAEKPRAQLYIDDKGYRFENWKDTMEFFEAWSK